MGRARKRGGEARRFLAVAMILRGATRREAATAHGVDRQTIRDWVARFNEAGPDGLGDKPRGGSAGRLDDSQFEEIARIVEAGPDPARDGVARWRLRDLRDWIDERFGVKFTLEGVRGLIRRLGFRHLSPRPFHPKSDAAAQEKFRRDFKALAMETVPKGVDPGRVEVWFQDEARAGQKGMLARLWARKGTRPRVVRDHRYGYCYLFSAACPRRGTSAGHVCDRANTGQMNRHLADIAGKVQEGGHAVVVLDGAGWHRSKDLEIPKGVSLLRLPPYSPGLNSMENVFGHLKSGKLANRLFDTVEDVREAMLEAWTEFAGQPDRIASIMTREWADIAK
ncbi:MAG: IS630 family transposase [Albidovulum sp.]|nr:IS630 family transposase [Albidovulum sp.]